MSTQISTLNIENLGDGRYMKVQWSVVDSISIKYFILERYDRHLRKWIPYDGFHGRVNAKIEGKFETPSYSVVVELDDSVPSQQSFRVQAAFLDNSISDWITASGTLEGTASESTSSRSYYVVSGLEVVYDKYLRVSVSPGSAILAGGVQTVVDSIQLGALSTNSSYIVYINNNGVLGRISTSDNFDNVQTYKVAGNAIRLANISVDSNGNISITDTRRLWAPPGLEVQYDELAKRPAVMLSWNEVLEPNTFMYKIYRGVGESLSEVDFIEIDTVDSNLPSKRIDNFPDDLKLQYESSDSALEKGKTYWYKVVTVDFGGKESLSGAPHRVYFDIESRPMPPNNLRAKWDIHQGSVTSLLYLDLSWDQENEGDVLGYRVYIKKGSYWDYQATVQSPNKTWRHSYITNGSTYTYAVRSFNEVTESHLSVPITVFVGDEMPPSRPEWDDFIPIQTGGDENSVWVDIKWKEVETNADGSAITDLAKYHIYQVEKSGEEKRYNLVHEARASESEARIHYRNFARGGEVTLVVTALDFFRNESAKSTEKKVTLGGHKPKAPEFTARYINDYGSDKVLISIDDVLEDENGRPLESQIVKYIIYRSRVRNPRTVLDSIEFVSGEESLYIDTKILRGATYYYSVVAMDSNGTLSDYQEYQSVTIGDFDSLIPPEITNWGTRVTEKEGIYVVENYLSIRVSEPSSIKGMHVYVSEEGSYFREVGYIPSVVDTNEYEFIHSGDVRNGLKYQYLVTASDYSNNIVPLDNCERTDLFIAGDITPPSGVVIKPESLWVNGHAGVRLSWMGLNNEMIKGYNIYRSSITDLGPFTLIASIEHDNDTLEFVYEDLGLVNRNYYFYKVLPVNFLEVESTECYYEDGHSSKVMAGDSRKPDTPELVEKSINFTSQSSATVTFSWDSEDDEVKVYKIYHSSSKNHGYTLVEETTNVSFFHSVPYGIKAYYRVVLVRDSMAESDPLLIELDIIKTTLPPKIERVFSSNPVELPSGMFSTRLYWTYEPQVNFGFYKIYSVHEDGTLIFMDSVNDQDSMEYTVSQLIGGNSYAFAVSVVDIFGNENTSGLFIKNITVSDELPPSPVANLKARGRELGIDISWDAPTTNENGTPLNDLSGYEIYYSEYPIDPEIMNQDPLAHGVLISRLSSNGYSHQTGVNKSYYYAVRAYDRSWNYSKFTVTDDVTTSKGVSGTSLDPSKPSPPEGLKLIDSGVALSNVDDTESVFASISWDPVASENISHYNIYLGSDHFELQHFAQSKGTEYTLYGLRTGIAHTIKVSSVSKVLVESDLSSSLSLPILGYFTKPPAPSVTDIKQYLGGLIISWNEAMIWDSEKEVSLPATHIKGYELQFSETDGDRPSIVDDSKWTHLSLSKSTYHIHARLNYKKYYYYRVRTLDSFGNFSDWSSFESVGDGAQPAQTGASDIAVKSVYAENIIGKSITGEHIVSEAIQGDHIAGKTITGEHLSGKTITGEHLKIEAGGNNLVSNSAFGMESVEDGSLGESWIVENREVCKIIGLNEDEEIPINRHALQFQSDDLSTSFAIQELATKSQILSISFDVKTEDVSDEGSGSGLVIDLCSYDNEEYHRLSSNFFRVVGSTSDGWTKLKKTISLSPYENIYLRILFSNTSGLARITNIMVEEGDLPTQWSHKSGEAYGAGGSVQINQTGILVKDGNLRVVTDSDSNGSSVIIDSSGIFAGNKSSKYAAMSRDGFTSIGGAFSVYTGTEDGSSKSISFDSEGIRAYGNSSKKTFEVLSSDGSVSIWGGNFRISTAIDGESDASSLTMDGQGIRLGDVFSLSTATNSLALAGEFSIASGPNPSTSGGFLFTKRSFKAYSGNAGNKKLTFLLDSDSGNVSMGSTLVLSSSGIDESGNPLVSGESSIIISTKQIGNNMPGIYAAGSQGSFSLRSDGKAEFENGSITIRSANSEIVFDEDGLRGNKFSLSQSGFSIESGNVTIDESGMSILGSGSGIRVGNVNNAPVVEINKEGIRVLSSKGIHIESGGSLTFGNNDTAIDSNGIKAESIKTGTIQISEGKDLKLVVGNDKVVIDENGVTIRDGAFRLFGKDHGSAAVIENGKISAGAIDITSPGLNLIRNGTGAFYDEETMEPDFWNFYNASVKTVTSIDEADEGSSELMSAGISSNYGIRVSSEDSNWGLSQYLYKRAVFKNSSGTVEERTVSSLIPGKTYTAIVNLYIISGKLQIQIPDAIGEDKSTLNPIAVSKVREWVKVPIRFMAKDDHNSSDLIDLRILPLGSSASGWTFYASDIMVVEGNVPSGYFRHESELIVDGLVSIKDGAFLISSTNGNVTIDRDGLTGPNFSLTDNGLLLDFDEQQLRLSKDGILAGDISKSYVKIDKDGIQSDGMFMLTSSKNGYMKIDGREIYMADSKVEPSRKITISPDTGLEILGSNSFVIRSSVNKNSDGIELTPESLTVKKSGSTKPVETVVIGKLPDSVRYSDWYDGVENEKMGYGLYVSEGNFYLHAPGDLSAGIPRMKISPAMIEMEHKSNIDEDRTITYHTRLSAMGLEYGADGEWFQYQRSVYISPRPVSANAKVNLPNIFVSKPSIVVIPSYIQTYSNANPRANQFLRCYPSEITPSSFVPVVLLSLDSAVFSSYDIVSGSRNYSQVGSEIRLGHRAEVIVETRESTATRLEILIEWVADKAHLFQSRDFVKFSVEFSYMNKNGTWSGWRNNNSYHRTGGGLFGSSTAGTEMIKSETVDEATKIRAKITTDINGGKDLSVNRVTVKAVEYTAESTITPPRSQEVYFICSEGPLSNSF